MTHVFTELLFMVSMERNYALAVLYAMNQADFSCLDVIGTHKTDVTHGLQICLVKLWDRKKCGI